MGGFGCDPAPCHASLQIPPLILNPSSPWKIPSPSSISCRRMQGGCRWPCCIKIIPYKQHNRAFPKRNCSCQATNSAVPALQTFPQVLLPDCQRISKCHAATCHRNAFSKDFLSPKLHHRLYFPFFFFPKGMLTHRKYLEADPGLGVN